MHGKVICEIVPKPKRGCCGGGAGAPPTSGFVSIAIKPAKEGLHELLVPGDKPPKAIRGQQVSHDNRFFTNCKLYTEGDSVPLLCAVFSPFRDQVILFLPRNGTHSSTFTEVQGAAQLAAYVQGAFEVSRAANVVDTGSGLMFNGVHGQNVGAAAADPTARARSVAELESEFWAAVLVLEALLYNATRYSLSDSCAQAMRTVFDAVSRQEKLDAIANWAACNGDSSLQRDLNEKAQFRAQIAIEAQKRELELQRERMKMEAEQLALAREQQLLAAQREALHPSASPAYQTLPQQQMYAQQPPQQMYPPMYQQMPPQQQQAMYPYPPAPPPQQYYNGPPQGYQPQYGNNHHQKSNHSTGKTIAMALGAGVLGALATEAIIN